MEKKLVSASGIVKGKLQVGNFAFYFKSERFRNENLINEGFSQQEATKTGTTIVGICFKDGVVLGADTRATSGKIVVEKECQKIFRIQDNI